MITRPGMGIVALALIAASAGVAHAQGSAPMKEETPGLLEQASVTPDSARRLALALVPAGRIESQEIELEEGKLAYAFDIVVAGREGVEEIVIDARTGALISREHETPEEGEDRGKEDGRPTRVKTPPAGSTSPAVS